MHLQFEPLLDPIESTLLTTSREYFLSDLKSATKTPAIPIQSRRFRPPARSLLEGTGVRSSVAKELLPRANRVVVAARSRIQHHRIPTAAHSSPHAIVRASNIDIGRIFFRRLHAALHCVCIPERWRTSESQALQMATMCLALRIAPQSAGGLKR